MSSKQAARACGARPSSKGISKNKRLSSNMHGLPSQALPLWMAVLTVKGFTSIKCGWAVT